MLNTTAMEDSDLYTELQQMADLFYGSGLDNKKNKQHRAELHVITQNLQGFKKERRPGWLRGWKQRTSLRPADVIYVQDTHLKTSEEIDEVAEMWNRVWGIKEPKLPLSYWSKMEGSSGGVGILLQPNIAAQASPWKPGERTGRQIGLRFREWTLVNIYAPTDRKAQRCFYSDLQSWISKTKLLLLGGDFNAVLQPSLDRIFNGLPSAKSCESVELDRLVDQLDLLDAVQLTTHADEDSVPDPLMHFSFWRKQSASRLDRFYLSSDLAGLAQWIEARPPSNKSDHQEVRLWLTLRKSSAGRKNKSHYPIRSASPEWVHKQIRKRLRKLKATFLQQSCPARAWDTFARQISIMLREVARMDKERTTVYYNNLRKCLNCGAKSREDLQRIANNSRVRQGQRAFGRTLQPTVANLKNFYKRHADWQRDQTISDISPSPGHYYPESMPIAEKMASEWNDIMGGSHATLGPSEMQKALREFHMIPDSQRLRPEEKQQLVNPIVEKEVADAIDKLPRDKSGGTTGLSHDFYKDFKDEMAECLTMVYQAIQKGAVVPSSFLDAVVVPLRKKGDSSNAMDYRPISLLNTAYKILGRIYAERIHLFLPRIISVAQQGFVRGRLMTKSVTVVQALLLTQLEDASIAWADSAAILGLDECKAYDTLDRSFLLTALTEFGFPQGFIDVLHSLHTGTTASYLVNGVESSKWEVNSGIRQGCPLAPLLFILAIDFLGRAIASHPEINGLEIPGSGGKRQVFSGFVDDCTVFLSATRQIIPLNHLLQQFGEMSGLKVQPKKSVLIPLNTAWSQKRCHGYPVLAKGDTTRILGYHFGNHDTTGYNWEIRLMNCKKRLQVATQVTNSVKQRVVLFNTVILPAILFTGMHFTVPREILKRLERLQKRFIWKGTTKEVTARHKISPGLVFAPEEQGGMGLQSIEEALAITRINQAEQWIQTSADNYQAAWHWLAHPTIPTSRDCCAFTPTTKALANQARRKKRSGWLSTVQAQGRSELWAYLTDQLIVPHDDRDLLKKVGDFRESIICFWVRGDTIKCLLNMSMSEQDEVVDSDYWRTSMWNGNAFIVDAKGKPLRHQDFPLFQPCTLMKLQVRVESPGVYLLTPPRGTKPFTIRHYRQVRRWCASIFACVPARVWTSTLAPIKPRNFPVLSQQYLWHADIDRNVLAFAPGKPHEPVLKLVQDARGWTWYIAYRNKAEEYDNHVQALKLKQNLSGLAFEATPFLHPTPWKAPPRTKGFSLRLTIFKTRSKRIRRTRKFSVQQVLDKMAIGAEQHEWARAAQSQQCTAIWQHDGILTDFQRWTSYRICTRTLNLYHAGWPQQRGCSYEQCATSLETIEHILWDCERAQEVWQVWIPHWIGHYPHRDELASLLPHLAARRPPEVSPTFLDEAMKSIPCWGEGQDEAMRILWLIWTTCTQCTLWLVRNREVFDGDQVSPQEAKRILWKTADFQTHAVIRGMASRPATKEASFRLDQCYAVFLAMEPSDRPITIQRWTLTFHSVKLDGLPGRRGIWVVLGNAPQEVIAIGFTQKNEPVTETSMAGQLIVRAMQQLKQRAQLSTVSLCVQGIQSMIKSVRAQNATNQALKDVVSIAWKPASKRIYKATRGFLKLRQLSKFTNAVLLREHLPVKLWDYFQEQFTSEEELSQHRLSIRLSLQRYQDSIV